MESIGKRLNFLASPDNRRKPNDHSRRTQHEGFEVFVCDSPESIKSAINQGLFGGVNVTEDL